LSESVFGINRPAAAVRGTQRRYVNSIGVSSVGHGRTRSLKKHQYAFVFYVIIVFCFAKTL